MQISIKNMQAAFPFLGVIFAGLLIFLLDYFEFVNAFAREVMLLPVVLYKSGYFIWFLLARLRRTADEPFYFHHFARFLALSVFLVVLSFALDYYCLFRIDETAFRGMLPHGVLIAEFFNFFYFSVSTFTTAGFGDIVPNSLVAQSFVTLQLSIGWLCTVLVIGNVAHIRESISQKKEDVQEP